MGRRTRLLQFERRRWENEVGPALPVHQVGALFDAHPNAGQPLNRDVEGISLYLRVSRNGQWRASKRLVGVEYRESLKVSRDIHVVPADNDAPSSRIRVADH